MKYITLHECLKGIRNYSDYDTELEGFINTIRKMPREAEDMFQQAIKDNDEWVMLAQKTKPQALFKKRKKQWSINPRLKIEDKHNPIITVSVFDTLSKEPIPVIILTV